MITIGEHQYTEEEAKIYYDKEAEAGRKRYGMSKDQINMCIGVWYMRGVNRLDELL